MDNLTSLKVDSKHNTPDHTIDIENEQITQGNENQNNMAAENYDNQIEIINEDGTKTVGSNTEEPRSISDTILNLGMEKGSEKKELKPLTRWWQKGSQVRREKQQKWNSGNQKKLYPPQGQRPVKVMMSLGMQGEPVGDPLSYDPDRNSFVAVVMLLVLIMLLMTGSFLILVNTSENLKDFFRRYSIFILIVSSIMLLIVHYSFMCYPYARVMPCCFVMLILAVVCMSSIAAVITSRYRTEIILYAAMATAGIALVCFLLALTPFDFTAWYLFVVVIAVAFSMITMMIFLGMMITGTYMRTLHMVILCAAVLLQAVILVIELQMILGGKAIELGEEDWALAAYMLYTSIVDIFIKMVQILGILDDM